MRSLISEKVREFGPRTLKIAGGGLLTLLISAVLISMRILLCDETDTVWDHPSMFWDVVKLSYDESSRSTWGPLWDIIFAIVPMWIYGGVFVPQMWKGDDEYAPYRRTLWDELRERIPAEPPSLEWGYAEYEVLQPPPEPVVRSRTITLRGFPALRPPAGTEGVSAATAAPAEEAAQAKTEFDEGWFLPDEP